VGVPTIPHYLTDHPSRAPRHYRPIGNIHFDKTVGSDNTARADPNTGENDGLAADVGTGPDIDGGAAGRDLP